MYKTLLLSAALIGSSLAQSSVVTMLVPQVGKERQVVGSVISADASRTEYSVTCGSYTGTATGEGASYCPLFGLRVLQYGSTVELHMTTTIESSTAGLFQAMIVDATCSSTASGADTATCVATLVSSARLSTRSSASTSTQTEVLSQLAALRVPVTITAGAEKLVAATATSRSSAAGMPRATQNAMLAGVAAVVGGVAML